MKKAEKSESQSYWIEDIIYRKAHLNRENDEKSPGPSYSRRRRRHQPRRRSMECVRGMCTRVGGVGYATDVFL